MVLALAERLLTRQRPVEVQRLGDSDVGLRDSAEKGGGLNRVGLVRRGWGRLDALYHLFDRQLGHSARVEIPKAPHPCQVARGFIPGLCVVAVPGQPRLPRLYHLAPRAIRLATRNRFRSVCRLIQTVSRGSTPQYRRGTRRRRWKRRPLLAMLMTEKSRFCAANCVAKCAANQAGRSRRERESAEILPIISALRNSNLGVNGGETANRTLGRLSPPTVFGTAPFDRSGTSPRRGHHGAGFIDPLGSAQYVICGFRLLIVTQRLIRNWLSEFSRLSFCSVTKLNGDHHGLDRIHSSPI